MSDVERLAQRAVMVGERLIAHGITKGLTIDIVKQGVSPENPRKMATGIEIKANPYLIVAALEEYVDALDKKKRDGEAGPEFPTDGMVEA